MIRAERRRSRALRAAAVGAGALALTAALAGCESTQSKSARIAREGGSTKVAVKGRFSTRQSRQVKVLSARLLQDQNGAAVIVAMHNRTGRPLLTVPVSFEVRDRRGRDVYRNDAAGLEPSLAGTALLPPAGTFLWVNDQVQLPQPAKSARAWTGAGRPARARPPRIVLSRPRLEQDPVSGIAASGKVTNESRIDQRKLVIYAVALKAGRPVAAGRAQVSRLKAGKRANYTIFFIGDPRGAALRVAAPPTTIS